MKRSRRGFSLVEVLFALVVLTIVITTSLAIFVERNRRLGQATETILAWQALSNESELRRRIDYGDLDPAAAAFPPTFLSSTDILHPLEPYAATVTVSPPKPGGLKVVTMSVRWAGGKRVARLEIVRADTGGSNLW